MPSTEEHVVALMGNLREADALEVSALGQTPDEALYHGLRRSVVCRTALVDGEVGAMWGVVPAAAQPVEAGTLWLLTAPCVSKHPFAFARIARREVREMAALFDVVGNIVDLRYEAALRLLEHLGFSFGPTTPTGTNGEMFVGAWYWRV